MNRILLLSALVLSLGCAGTTGQVPQEEPVDWTGTPIYSTPAAAPEKEEPAQGPCADSLYLALKAKQKAGGLTALSDREYQYFNTHDQACLQWQGEAQQRKSLKSVGDYASLEHALEIAGLIVCGAAIVIYISQR